MNAPVKRDADGFPVVFELLAKDADEWDKAVKEIQRERLPAKKPR